MKGFVCGAAFLLGLAALAAPARAQDHHPTCTTIAKVQKAIGKGTSVLPMNGAQFHFLQGLYVGLPSTPDGLPPGDGALIVKSDDGDSGLIVWTRGPLACDPIALPKAGKLLKYLAEIKAGAGDAGDDL